MYEFKKNTIGVNVQVPKDLHDELKELAKETRVPISALVIELYSWAVKKDAETLRKYGVNLPQWPNS